jgi:hypothetical protein
MPKLKYLLPLITFFSLSALAVPDLKDQGSWGSKQKNEFLRFLKSEKQIPISGNVKSVSTSMNGSTRYRNGRTRFITANFGGSNLYLTGKDNVRRRISSNIGGKLLYGRHIFTWMRFYGGIQYSAIDQQKLDGQLARLKQYQIPLGLEFALIPLGTPQTRYVLLRAGVSAHYFEGNFEDSDFNNSLLGLRGSYNLGLGYEWQIPNSRFRLHALAEGLKSISNEKGSSFNGAGISLGLVYSL